MITVKGKIKIKDKWINFKRSYDNLDKNSAVEKTYTLMGSNHRLARTLVKIEEVKEEKEPKTTS